MPYIKMPSKDTTVWSVIKNVKLPDETPMLDQIRSRVIECILLRIPLPPFYARRMSQSEPMVMLMGTERLCAVKDFVAGEYPLTGLKLLTTLEGQKWKELPKHIQTRIKNTKAVCHIIEPETEDEETNFIISSLKVMSKLDRNELES